MSAEITADQRPPRMRVMPDRASPAYRERNSTADRALDILLMFGEERLSVSATDVATHLQVARSTAYRYLQSLQQGAFIEERPAGGFQLGPRILELARLARRGSGLSEVAQPFMRQLADSTGETVLLTRLAGPAVLCLERAQAADQAVRISYERGQVLPTNAGASAHVLLAWLDDAELDEILAVTRFTRFTDKTIVGAAQLRRRLAETRAHGYAISRGELDEDVLGIATPIRGAHGKVVAGISIAAVATRISDDRAQEIVGELKRAAASISERLELLDAS